ncbi:splicing factor YJU2 isoform X2 [Pyrus x bretschneideri]|uniref:splicing factor YJU2 isoform X2 n=1 Tax=Pyrus x bretschneideri TaxID=225117 RepID=UPI00202FDD39|nr:splicing factor YJU2 isoform X2 [Pyrus x bretschneideri]
MGERKVLNKYYPPDFDPSKLPRIRRPKNQQIKVRMMLPMSIRCNTCGNYIYKGTKFNSRKEDVVGETYLGIQIFRFYFKCTKCSAELAMKTDPQNSDYVVEAGATRNFEPWRNEDEEVDKEKQKRESEEMGDAMRALENRTQDSKREMDVMAALDEMKSMKEKRIEEEDEAVIKSIVFHNSKDYIKRIHDEDLDDEEDMIEPLSGNGETSVKRKKLTHGLPDNSTDWLTNSSISDRGNRNGSEAAKFPFKSSTVRVAVVKKPVAAEGKKSAEAEDKKKQSGEEVQNSTKPDKSKTKATTNVLQSLCQYDSDDSDE